MKKIFFFVAVMFAAVAVNAAEVVVDLSKAEGIYTSASGQVTPTLNSGELTVDWKIVSGDWDVAGVEFPISEINGVTNIVFDYKGDGADIVIYPYLRDVEGNRWMKAEYWPNAKNTTWTPESFIPDECPWDGATYKFGDKAFNKIGFVANPAADATGKFYLRNIKITAAGGTGIDKITNDQLPITNKVLRDGQLVIIRNGVEYNAAGQMK